MESACSLTTSEKLRQDAPMATPDHTCHPGPSPQGVFVYGTLKQGEERAEAWPRSPRTRQRATTRGILFDLGPYPAMLPGNDLVGGEFWEITAQDMPVTLQVLDHIEGYNQGGANLYERRVIACHLETGKTVSAYTYFLAQSDMTHALDKIAAGSDGIHRWRRGSHSRTTEQ